MGPCGILCRFGNLLPFAMLCGWVPWRPSCLSLVFSDKWRTNPISNREAVITAVILGQRQTKPMHGMCLDHDYIARFKSDLCKLPTEDVFARYIAPDYCAGLTQVDERTLRERIAGQFKIQTEHVLIVGSAKLGFTLRHKPAREPDEEDRPAFSPFSENSDVDVAIISSDLFDNIWKRCFEFWHTSGYGNAPAYWPGGRQFRDYIFRGWMRPDKLPSEGGFRYRAEWFDIFRRLTSERAAGDYKIAAGLYRESYFLERYQYIALNECRASMGATP